MPSCDIRIKTEHASKYLQQLCKHFAHKVEVTFDKNNGCAALPPGPCTMVARPDELYIHCQSDDAQKLPMSRSIIEIHLVKFAWREEFAFDWSDCPDLEQDKGA